MYLRINFITWKQNPTWSPAIKIKCVISYQKYKKWNVWLDHAFKIWMFLSNSTFVACNNNKKNGNHKTAKHLATLKKNEWFHVLIAMLFLDVPFLTNTNSLSQNCFACSASPTGMIVWCNREFLSVLMNCDLSRVEKGMWDETIKSHAHQLNHLSLTGQQVMADTER